MDPTNAEVSQKLDRLMEKEIRQFHATSLEQNLRRWEHLQMRLDKERAKDQAVSDILRLNTCVSSLFSTFWNLQIDTSKALKVNATNGTLSSGVTKRDLELEELRLDAYYNSNWGEIETFNLTEAFNSQVDLLSRFIF